MTEQVTLTSEAPVEAPEVFRVRKREIDKKAYRPIPDQTALRESRLAQEPEKKVARTMRQRWLEMGYRNALREDVTTLLRGNWVVYDEDRQEVVIAYLQPPESLQGLVPYLHQIRFNTSARPDGSPSTSKVAGWQDENRIRQRDVCTFSKLHKENPRAGAAVLSYGVHAARWYQELDPEKYRHHQELTRHILPRYHLRPPDAEAGSIEETPFTSAIVNKDNVLPYHFDKGNVPGSWSMMIGYKRDVEGGVLVIPEYDLALEVADNTISCFDGQVALHGVTPFRRLSRYAYRYTIVYYAKAGMWRCLPTDAEEVRKGQLARTRKERSRWERDRGKEAAEGQFCSGCGKPAAQAAEPCLRGRSHHWAERTWQRA